MTETTTAPAAANNTPAIEVRGLTIGYGSRVVLENLNFRIKPGQIVTILGGSGCGKSTLLKHIIGLYKPLRGDILMNDCSKGCNYSNKNRKTDCRRNQLSEN